VDAVTDTTTVVERELAIDATPETVWEFLVDPEKATRWMGMRATLDPRPGGAYRVEVIPGNTAVGEFLELDPPHRLVQTWGWDPSGGGDIEPGSTRIEYELIANGDATILRFRHELPTPKAAESHGHGWDHYFERLVVAAAGKEPGVDPWIEAPMS
jgi:uncharacterized protein YndB with AHSA1/START domain